jgi:hypothetical protein
MQKKPKKTKNPQNPPQHCKQLAIRGDINEKKYELGMSLSQRKSVFGIHELAWYKWPG